jgi:HEAT repeat protein
VTADHGEAFDEHGERYHGTSLYDEQVRVPLILKLPGQPAAAVHMPVSLLDVTPTLLSLVRAPAPSGLQGQSLVSSTDGTLQLSRPPVLAELGPMRMVVSGNHKLLCNITWGGCTLHDLSLDPGEYMDSLSGAAAVIPELHDELDRAIAQEAADFAATVSPWDPRWTLIGRALLGDRTVAMDLTPLLAPDVPLELRKKAARSLAELSVPFSVAATLKRAMRDKDEETAGWATVAGLTLQLRAARTSATRLLARSATPIALRTSLALILGEQGNRAALPALLEALPVCAEPVRCQRIVRALGQLRDARAIPVLLDALPRLEIRREVVDALGEIADPTTVEPLITCLMQDAYVPVRAAAARALGKLQVLKAKEALLQAAQRDTESVVVTEAWLAAARLRAER